MDEITIRTEIAPDFSGKEFDQVKARLRENLKVKTNLSFHVQMEPPGSLPRYTLKAKRFRDTRESEKND
jgi:phenylacetate-CoA ligase